MNNGYRYLREDTYIVEKRYEDKYWIENLENYESNMNRARKNIQWLVNIYAY